jgi:uncharacterized NAD-dependent epimerase/dehydratase family protein
VVVGASLAAANEAPFDPVAVAVLALVVLVVSGGSVEVETDCGPVVDVVSVEEQSSVSPAVSSAFRAAPNVRPTTFGTFVPLGKHPDQVIPTHDPLRRVAPGDRGIAPAWTSGGRPATDRDSTMLSLPGLLL